MSDPTGANRTIRYQVIADHLRQRVSSGEFAAGALLPSESELSAEYEASRVTVRRALEALRAERLVDSRQGFGWFVAADPLRQELHHLGTIDSQLRAAGLTSERRILSFSFTEAPSRVADILGERNVLEVRRLNLADGQPFALVTVWCPEALGAELSRADVERASFLEQLPVEFGGASQTIGAEAASAETGKLLDVPVGSPLLVAERVTRTVSGRPVLVSRHVFAAHRTEFAVELPAAADVLGPAGLRLVE
ncbi:MAG: GntR family transcriptional regulator [Acidimicrobiales bacterium]